MDFPPLLPVGLHPMTLSDLRALCVTAFPLSVRRDPAMRSIEVLCTSLSTALLRTEVWIDGGFFTQKIDPGDADLVVRVPWAIFENATDEQRALFGRIANKQFGDVVPCDSYLMFSYPESDPRYATGDMMEAYWKRQFTNAFSKKVENLEFAVALHFMYYNFARIHQTLRVSPAMEAGITDHLWSLEEIAALPETLDHESSN